MIPGLIDHLNGAATILTNPNSIRRSDKDSSISDADIKVYEIAKIQYTEYQELVKKLIRQNCGNENPKSKIACLSDSREIYVKLRSISATRMTL